MIYTIVFGNYKMPDNSILAFLIEGQYLPDEFGGIMRRDIQGGACYWFKIQRSR